MHFQLEYQIISKSPQQVLTVLWDSSRNGTLTLGAWGKAPGLPEQKALAPVKIKGQALSEIWEAWGRPLEIWETKQIWGNKAWKGSEDICAAISTYDLYNYPAYYVLLRRWQLLALKNISGGPGCP